MLARTAGTYAKLEKVFTGTPDACRDIIRKAFCCMPWAHIVKCVRGMNDIYYYRPAGGQYINDKIATVHYNPDGTAALFL